MISLVAKVINLFALTVQKAFALASFIGQVIVTVITGISSTILNVIQNVLLFFQIVYEDNLSIFTEDLPHFANDVFNTIASQWSHLEHGLYMVFCSIYFKISAILGTIKWLVSAVFLIISEVLCVFKSSIIFTGDTIWLILTFIPVHLPQLLSALAKTVADIIVTRVVDAYLGLLKITNFLTDVPLESFIGITSAIVIARLIIHFKETIQDKAFAIYWSLVRTFWYYYYALYNYFVDQEVREITRMSSGQDLGTRQVDSTPTVDDGSAADALCVICQERQKCVLTLPCRHVCLCTECCMRLYGYQRTCPICRTFIYHSVTVYL